MNPVRYCSFDVFDTMVFRDVGNPRAIYFLAGLKYRGATDGLLSPWLFKRLRTEAEDRLRPASEGREVHYREIYAALESGLPSSEDRQWHRFEMEIERRHLHPYEYAMQRLAEARAEGWGVAFVSDMYWDEEDLRTLLTDFGMLRDGDLLFVSNSKKKNKASGALYHEVRAAIEARGGVYLKHIGNNPESDGIQAEKAGLQAEVWGDCNLNRYENILESFDEKTHHLSSFFAGISRRVRLRKKGRDERTALLRNVAAGVAAPLLTAYVLWLLRDARDAGVQRLYFVSRDGQILLKIAKALKERAGFQGELRYLHGSRQAWHLAAVFAQPPSGIEIDSWFNCISEFLSVRSWLARASLKPEELADFLGVFGFPKGTWDCNLTKRERSILRRAFGRQDFLARVRERAAAPHALLDRYFEQEGLYDPGVASAIVDVGWSGNLLKALSYFTQPHAVKLRAYYVGLDLDTLPPHLEHARSMFELPRGKNKLLTYSMVAPLEVFCAANHGRVIGYRSDELTGRIEPVLESASNDPALKWGLATVHECVEEFARDLAATDADLQYSPSLGEAARAVLTEFWTRPQPAEARVWGEFHYENDQSGRCVFPLASPLSLRRAIQRGKPKWSHDNAWRAAELMLTPRHRLWPRKTADWISNRARQSIQSARRWAWILSGRRHRANAARKQLPAA